MSTREIIKTTCPRDCYDGCGIAVVKRDGKITKVLGDPDHPVARGALCGKCAIAYNGVWLDPEARLLHPMRRTGPKGSGQFEQISWDEAIGTIAAKLKEISAADGAQAILHTHYTGTCSTIANNFPERFFSVLGATEALPDSICNNAGHAAWGYVFGTSAEGFDPRQAKDSACIVVWGANPSASAPHVHKHWLKESPAKIVVIDPVRHDSAVEADLHLQLFPGSDAALAFGLMHIARRDGLLDHDYIAAHVLGYDAVEADIEAATPEWTAEKTGLAIADIEEAARLYATGPSLLWLGQGLQRQHRGGNIFRACAMLPAFTGNIGKPGAGFYYLNGSAGIIARKGVAPEYHAPDGGDAAPEISQMDVPAALNDPDRFKAYMVWNCNPVASNPDQAKMISGLARDDLFTVVIDPFPTDTASYADIVLPAASFLEFDDLSGSYFHLTVGAQVKAAEPMGDSLPNQEIFRRLATAMGFEQPFLHRTDQEMIDKALKSMDCGVGWEELKEKGWVWGTAEPLNLWADGTFPTPSGKIEIASEAARADGHPLAPLPTVDDHPSEGHLRLLSPAGKWLMNSSYGNDPRLQEL
ncbi:MAG: molybdopterin-dependent oxidoreductase, partial [Rhodospirillaceae bacterium]|nr:molybdopterin-dependent oxidoreductase [Rhodospirillaceae bacterium]